MPLAVIVNASAGSPAGAEAAAGRVAEELRRQGLMGEVSVVPPARLGEAARTASASGRQVVMAGGDGTLSAGAASLAGTAERLGVLPLGTRNHFARDLGIPLELEGAVSTLAEGAVRRVDVGEIEGRIFLNNCSIGLYPEVVHDREHLESRRGMRRAAAMARAVWLNLRRLPVVTLSLKLDRQTLRVTTPLVFIGNNRHQLAPGALGRRERLDEGRLYVYVARPSGRLGLFRLALRALSGRVEGSMEVDGRPVSEVEILSRWRHLRVALDGEVVHLGRRARCRVRPGALRVIAPQA